LPKRPRTRDQLQLAQTLRTFRVVHAGRGEIVVRHGGLEVDFRQLEPHRAAVLFRRGELDEAPVPLGDIRAALADPTVKRAVRVNRLDQVDTLVASRLPLPLRQALSATADRRDYALLVPEDRTAATRSPPARAFRAARRNTAGLSHTRVRIAVEGDATLRYGASLLVASWRDLGFNVRIAQHGANATFVRSSRPGTIPVAHVVDARFVSPRVHGWREDANGLVDYARVTLG